MPPRRGTVELVIAARLAGVPWRGRSTLATHAHATCLVAPDGPRDDDRAAHDKYAHAERGKDL